MKMSFLLHLLLLFIAFRLADIIDWSWWWVLSPLAAHIALLAMKAAFIVFGGRVLGTSKGGLNEP